MKVVATIAVAPYSDWTVPKGTEVEVTVTLGRADVIRLHDLLAMSWFPTRHPSADDADLAFVDDLNAALMAALPTER